ncbi:ABC transporter permease [Bacillus inaquosorum]|uniref:ABC transporter permease n=1 Tax=Bacillus inaquosorum TaxID=483913 RepID=UPI00228038B1|nr:ABC transporter permease [Bacillus inaquosorum]MCY8069985.1 ABC transporter permease [Bacillus inaquosorum]MCY9378254.1 ABC transporter permease [Bacillus inaquosorum]
MFYQLLKNNIKDVFGSNKYKFSLLIMILLFGIDIFVSVYQKFNMPYFDKSHLSFSLYFWLGTNDSVISGMLILLFALISCLPYSTSVLEEKKSGYFQFVMTRSSAIKYFVAKLITSFISGGFLFVFPFLLSFILMAIMFGNNLTSGQFVENYHLFHQIAKYHPNIYMLIYIFILFYYAGSFAILGVCLSTFLKNRYLAYLSPFLIVLVLEPVFEIFYPQLSPILLMNPIQSITGISVFYVLVVPSFVLIVSLIGCFIGMKKYVQK